MKQGNGSPLQPASVQGQIAPDPRGVAEQPAVNVDPEGLLTTLLATGLAPFEAAVHLWRTGIKECQERAVQETGRLLLESTGKHSHESRKADPRFETEVWLPAMLKEDAPLVNRSLREACTGLEVAGNLDLRGIKHLRNLPAGMTVGKNLVLSDCKSLQAIPEDLTVGWALLLHNCTGLKEIPKSLKLQGHLVMDGCSRLRSLPEGLCGYGSLHASRCTSLESLPDGLSFKVQVILEGCTALKHLPAGLQVGDDLYLQGCTAWDGIIPADAKIGGKIRTDSHPVGIALDRWREEKGRR